MSNLFSFPHREIRAQCFIHRGNRILLVKVDIPSFNKPLWILPGGGVEEGETPEEAAIRELREECLVEGTIVRLLQDEDYSQTSRMYNRACTYLMDIGDQEPVLGTDPEVGDHDQFMVDMQWLTLAELPERDRAMLLAAGMMTVEVFRNEIMAWGNAVSYPKGDDNG